MPTHLITSRAVLQSREDAPTRYILGGSIATRLRSETTAASLGLSEHVVPGGFPGPPLHVHPEFDETFYLLEGELVFRVGEEPLRAQPGTVAFIPRGTPHTFANTSSEPARVLVVCTPGGFERYFEVLADEVEATGGIPTPERLLELNIAHGSPPRLEPATACLIRPRRVPRCGAQSAAELGGVPDGVARVADEASSDHYDRSDDSMTVDVQGFHEAHEAILAKMDELRAAAEQLPELAAAEREEALSGILDHLRRRVEPHTMLDERQLYPAAARRMGDPFVASSMNYDHLAIRRWIADLAEADAADVPRLQQLLYGLDAVIRVHLWKEDRLFLAPLEERAWPSL
jgi:mannose-6-phosphate isomerase-like protein (cupin superfamily)